MWRGWGPAPKGPPNTSTSLNGWGWPATAAPGEPSHQAAPSGSGRRPYRIITLSWWPDIDDIRAFTGEHFELAQCHPEDDEYLEPRSPHYEVASPADDGALPHTFREDHP